MSNIMKHSIRSNRIFTYFLSIGGALLGFLLNILLARVLNLQQLDKVKYLVSLIGMIANFLVIGLPTFMTREANAIEKDHLLASKCYSLYFSFALLAAPIVYFLLKNYVVFTSGDLFLSILIVLVSVFYGFILIYVGFSLGRRKYNLTYIIETIIPKGILLLLVIVFGCLHEANLLSDYYVLFYLIIYFVLSVSVVFKDFKKITFSFSKSEITSICFFYSISIAQNLTLHLSTIIQGNLFPEIVGVISTLSTSALLMSVVSVFTNVLSLITRPIFAEKHKKRDLNGIIEVYRYSTRTNLYLAIPIYLFFIFFPNEFLSIFNAELVQYSGVFIVSVISSLVSNFCGTTGAMLSMTGHEKKQVLNTLIQFLVFIVCAFVFSGNSIYGMALSTMIAEVVITIIKFIEVGFIFKKAPFDSKTLFSIILPVIIDIVIIGCFKFINISNILVWFFVAIFVGLLVVVINLFVSPNGRNDIKRIINFGGKENESNH